MILRVLVATALAASALVPLVVPRTSDASVAFPGWPTEFEGRAIEPIAAAPEDARLAERFPGRMARFAGADFELVLFFATEPTHELHSAELCYRGAGFEVEQLPTWQDSNGDAWSRFRARLGEREFDVRERIRDASGASFDHASTWWWAAVLGRTSGPWWRELVVS